MALAVFKTRKAALLTCGDSVAARTLGMYLAQPSKGSGIDGMGDPEECRTDPAPLLNREHCRGVKETGYHAAEHGRLCAP